MGYKLKEARDHKKMTQEELAVKSNVSRGVICRLESGQEVITTTETLKKLAQALDMKVGDIFFD